MPPPNRPARAEHRSQLRQGAQVPLAKSAGHEPNAVVCRGPDEYGTPPAAANHNYPASGSAQRVRKPV